MISLITKDLTYRSGNAEIKAYLAYPDHRGRLPGLIVIHEIFGVNEHIKKVAERFANEGYAVIAPDLYSRPESPSSAEIQKAMQFMFSIPPAKQRDQAFVQEEMAKLPESERGTVSRIWGWMTNRDYTDNVNDLKTAFNWLADQEFVANDRIGCLGFCMGGTLTGRLASSGEKLKAAIIFYGENPPADQIKEIRCPVLGLYGGEDHRITDKVPEFDKEMKANNKKFTFHVYDKAHHAFFNDTGKNYNKEAADDAWNKATGFLSGNLK